MLSLYLSLHLLCADNWCDKVATGTAQTPTPVGSYELQIHGVPDNKQAEYGPIWLQIGEDSDSRGIHGYPSFSPGYRSHGCVRVSQITLAKLQKINPTTLRIVK